MTRSSWAVTRPRALPVKATLAMLLTSSAAASAAAAGTSGLHKLSGQRIDAATVTMADFVGKPVLMVNVASR